MCLANGNHKPALYAAFNVVVAVEVVEEEEASTRG
jgi:hypothetical protein